LAGFEVTAEAEDNVMTLDKVAEFLDRKARIHCPESVYALGKLEHGRRKAVRVAEEAGRSK
jgi:hypothetical protein